MAGLGAWDREDAARSLGVIQTQNDPLLASMSEPVTWVVQANLKREPREDVALLLGKLGIPCVGVNVIPFSDELTFLFHEPVGDRVIPYGSTSLLRHAVSRNWKGLFFDRQAFRVDTWLSHRKDMLNQDAVCLSAAAALDWCADQPERDWHVRPVEDLKIFAGTIMRTTELKDWLAKTEGPPLVNSDLFSKDTPIAISLAKPLKAEWRWMVVGGKIVDGSLYRWDGRPRRCHEDDDAVIREAQSLADGWLPHETCVMDVALTDEGPKVIEFNCLNGSGFYDHDIPKILSETTAYVERLPSSGT